MNKKIREFLEGYIAMFSIQDSEDLQHKIIVTALSKNIDLNAVEEMFKSKFHEIITLVDSVDASGVYTEDDSWFMEEFNHHQRNNFNRFINVANTLINQ